MVLSLPSSKVNTKRLMTLAFMVFDQIISCLVITAPDDDTTGTATEVDQDEHAGFVFSMFDYFAAVLG
jgi:hypothetical protein